MLWFGMLFVGSFLVLTVIPLILDFVDENSMKNRREQEKQELFASRSYRRMELQKTEQEMMQRWEQRFIAETEHTPVHQPVYPAYAFAERWEQLDQIVKQRDRYEQLNDERQFVAGGLAKW